MIKKIALLTLCVYYISLTANAQPIGSFYLDASPSWCKFSTDAIYFYGSELIKTDYNGNVIWTVSASPFSKITVEGNSIYGTNGIKVFKFDTAGNSIWTKDFSTQINPLDSFPNNISDVIFDGNKLFVCIQQNSRIFDDYSPGSEAIITLDTSGNILNAVLDTNFIVLEQTFGAKSLRKGGWLSYYTLSGIVHGSYINRIDSSGNFDTKYLVICAGQGAALMKDIIPMADSTYMIVSNSGDLNSWELYCTKITENGTIIWSHGYAIDSTFYPQAWALNTVVDSLNNTYIIGNGNGSYFAAKLDVFGNAVFAKAWTHPNNSFDFTYYNYHWVDYDLNATHYKDGKIYCFVNYGASLKPAILIFDTLFNNSCYAPDSNVTLFQNGGLSGNPYQPIVNTFSYISSNSFINTANVANPVWHDLCASLDVKNISHDNSVIIISPNPLTSSSTLQLNTQVNNAEVVIYDMVGKELLRKKFTGDRMEIEKGSLERGVYFVRVVSEERQWVEKMVVE